MSDRKGFAFSSYVGQTELLACCTPVHRLKPDRMQDYTKLVSSELPRINNDPDFPAKLLGSWTTLYGPLDSAVHLWVYSAGYEDVTKAKHYLHSNENFLKFSDERASMLQKRYNQLLPALSFWGEPKLRDSKNLYELRTYYLKPGTLIEWGNNWMNALKYRQKINEDVGGFFTQIGELYVVHHLWAYPNLSVRKETREAAWNSPNWSDCVANTGEPLGGKGLRYFAQQIWSSTDQEDGIKDYGAIQFFTTDLNTVIAIFSQND